MSRWILASSSDPRALAIVDGTGIHAGRGAHYSRRTPGSKTFTGVGREVVLVTQCLRAVWAVVYQRTPSARGTGASRGRTGTVDAKPRHIWRNMVFRNLGAGLSSDLIREATEATYDEWIKRYGELQSSNPGFCYLAAGWEHDRYVRGKRYLFAPVR